MTPLNPTLPNVERSEAATWKPLWLLSLYRLVVAGFLLLVFESGPRPTPLGGQAPALFAIVAWLYALFSITCLVAARRRSPAFVWQSKLQVFTDIVAIILLMHASGGPTSGLGILAVIAVAGGGILLPGRQVIFAAAFGTLAVLGQQIYSAIVYTAHPSAYTHAGLLGATFFATALLSNALARRARESEALATQRGIDLANMEQLNDYIIRHLDSGVLVVDPNNYVRLLNESAWRLLGEPAAQRQGQLARLSPELAGHMTQWRAETHYDPQPFQPRSDAAAVLPRFVQIGSGQHSGTLIFLEDSTRVSHQVQQAKLASLGRLTASIAHEIRNPLGAISHAAQLLHESPHLERSDQRLTEIIQDHSRRMNTIVSNVLHLSRRTDSHARHIPLAPMLETFKEEFCTVEHLRPEQLQIDIDDEQLQIYMDPDHLQQTLWNLCQNALKHGYDEPQDARLSLRARGRDTPGSPCLDVLDEGRGIDQETAEQMFEPFFTSARGGTGLGLYITRELCECNKARLNYLPRSNGSCFRISFHEPRTAAPLQAVSQSG